MNKKEIIINKDTQNYYNKYNGKITCAYKKDIKVDKKGCARCFAKRTEQRDKYIFNGITKDIVLIENPKDELTIEFENKVKIKEETKKATKKQIREWIKQTVTNAKDHNIDCCITDHGGTSPYFRACNWERLIEKKEKECKKEILKLIVPKEAWDFVDKSNLGNTLVPIIDLPHWKPKYKGTIHKIVEGKHPTKHKNKIPDLILQRVFDAERPVLPKRDYDGDDINSISITSVVPMSGLKKRGQEYQGANPWHGSDTGMNFTINPNKNVVYCFRCGEGFGVAKAIALNKGIISNCDDDLSAAQFKEVLDIAREDYGLKKKDKGTKIKKAAEEYTNYMLLADHFIGTQPIFYDKNKIW